MLTTIETAEILGVKPVSIRVWLNEEGHPRFPNAHKFGRDWQIPESDLKDLPRGRGRGRPPKPVTDANGQAATSPAIEAELAAKPAKKRAGKKATTKASKR